VADLLLARKLCLCLRWDRVVILCCEASSVHLFYKSSKKVKQVYCYVADVPGFWKGLHFSPPSRMTATEIADGKELHVLVDGLRFLYDGC